MVSILLEKISVSGFLFFSSFCVFLRKAPDGCLLAVCKAVHHIKVAQSIEAAIYLLIRSHIVLKGTSNLPRRHPTSFTPQNLQDLNVQSVLGIVDLLLAFTIILSDMLHPHRHRLVIMLEDVLMLDCHVKILLQTLDPRS